MVKLGPVELLIILSMVIVLFGVGRIGKIGGELGSGIRSFKDALSGGAKNKDEEKSESENSSDSDKSA